MTKFYRRLPEASTPGDDDDDAQAERDAEEARQERLMRRWEEDRRDGLDVQRASIW